MDKIYNVRDFGILYEGENITDEQKWANTNTIQTAIDAAGKSGGGTVLIPEGIYCLNGEQNRGGVPGDPDHWDTACLYIAYDNITLSGAGMDKTKLITTAEFKVINNNVQRVHGIRIMTPSNNPLTKVTFKDFDLFGGTHGTGNIHWPADLETGDGWDIMHKGIAIQGGTMGDMVLDHVAIHGYRGELMYVACKIRSVTMRYCKTYDTNAQCYNASAHFTRVENCQFGHPDYISNTWIEFANYNRFPELENGSCVFKNCYFTNNSHNAISFNEGLNENYSVLFENNIFDLHKGISYNGVSCFVFDGGTSGPMVIKNNAFISRHGSIAAINSDCWEGRHRHIDENFIIENNYFWGFRALMALTGAYGAPNPERMTNNRFEKQFKNMVIRNNVVDCYQGEGPRPVVILGNDKETMIDYLDTRWQSKCLSYFENIVIENNTFNNAITPWLRDHFGSAPVFRNNRYNNPTLKLGRPASYSAILPVSNEDNRVVPVFEFVLLTAESECNVRLRTHNPMELMVPDYADGYEVLIGGYKGTAPITFKPDDTNTWGEPVVIHDNNFMRVRFDREKGRWTLIEVVETPLNYQGDGADTSELIGIIDIKTIGTENTVINDFCLDKLNA